jgi:hypothetical protein
MKTINIEHLGSKIFPGFAAPIIEQGKPSWNDNSTMEQLSLVL